MSKEDLSKALDAYLSTFGTDGTLSGVVLVAKDGKPVFEKAYGLADRSNNVPNTLATRFSLGSINKAFTQTAIAQLVAAGKLSYTDTLGALIPDYPQEQTRTATIEQLLRHTAGIADFFGEEFVKTPKDRFRSNADYYRFVSSKPPLFAPGARNQYCNGCYITLGAIIERVSSMPYERYIAEHVFKPAGMSAAFPQADAIEPNIAQGYTRRGADGQVRSSIFMRGAAGSAAGGAYATAGDLIAFDNALRERRLLDEKGLARIFSSASGNSGRVMGNFGIAGGAPGTNAVLESDGVWTVVVLTNFDPPTGESLGLAIQKALAR
jgi:CubicO group peptidase (beta-lactamase class C family)